MYRLNVLLVETVWGYDLTASLWHDLPGAEHALLAQRSDRLDYADATAPTDALGSTLWVLREWAVRMMPLPPNGRWAGPRDTSWLDGGGWGGEVVGSAPEGVRSEVE